MDTFQGYWSFSFPGRMLYASIGASKLLGYQSGMQMFSLKQLAGFLSKSQLRQIAGFLQLSKNDNKEYNLEVTIKQKEGEVIPCWLSMQCFKDLHSGQLVACGMISSGYYCGKENERVCNRSHDLLNSKFLTTISHEVLTPLNIIIGYSKIIRGKKRTEKETREFSGYIHDSAYSLYEMFTEVLDLSRLYAGKLELNNRMFHVSEVLESVSGKYRKVFETKYKGRKLLIDDSLKMLLIQGDMGKMIQIMDILTDNAIKFSYSGDITVGVKMVSRKIVRFYVRNTGVPIPHEIVGHLFNPFSRYDESLSRKTGGLGIGLSLARGLAHLMSGQLGLSQDGETLEFYIDLPYR